MAGFSFKQSEGTPIKRVDCPESLRLYLFSNSLTPRCEFYISNLKKVKILFEYFSTHIISLTSQKLTTDQRTFKR